jgi:hypothetical protein
MDSRVGRAKNRRVGRAHADKNGLFVLTKKTPRNGAGKKKGDENDS